MSQRKRYPIANPMRQLAGLWGIEQSRVLKRAGLAPDFLDHADNGVTALEFFALNQAVFEEVGNPNLALELGQRYAQGPYQPAILAFSSSPNTEIGLSRLALFKTLMAPVALSVVPEGGSMLITIGSSSPDALMPADACAFELVYFLECTRIFTAHRVVPLAVELPMGHCGRKALSDFFGVELISGPTARVELSLEDAQRPLISENEAFWRTMKLKLQRQLAEQGARTSLSERVKAALVDLLPAGDASADAVRNRLGMSKRSLQRKLKEEGESFQSLLDATRSELSMLHLTKGEMCIEEISYLLAYRDPNSFYRAFHGWTGKTPAEARGQVLQ